MLGFVVQAAGVGAVRGRRCSVRSRMCLANPVAGKISLKNAEGEWTGYEVSFSPKTAKRLPLPEHYIPDEFRNWDVTVYGFDCVTSMSQGEEALKVKLTRALPTVGCEADAVVTEVWDSLTSLKTEDGFFGFENGCYSKGPLQYASSARWEHCLALENGQRVRIIFGEVDGSQKVTVFREMWDMEYREGALLPGCGSKIDRIESDGRRDVAPEISGNWQRKGWVSRKDGASEEVDECVSLSSEPVKLNLTNGISLDKRTGKSGSITLEASWQPDPDFRVTVKRSYGSDMSLEMVSNFVERRS